MIAFVDAITSVIIDIDPLALKNPVALRTLVFVLSALYLVRGTNLATKYQVQSTKFEVQIQSSCFYRQNFRRDSLPTRITPDKLVSEFELRFAIVFALQMHSAFERSAVPPHT